jgi:hypothetical protein
MRKYKELKSVFYVTSHPGIHTSSYYKDSPASILDSRHDTRIKKKPPTIRSVSNAFVHEYTWKA